MGNDVQLDEMVYSAVFVLYKPKRHRVMGVCLIVTLFVCCVFCC